MTADLCHKFKVTYLNCFRGCLFYNVSEHCSFITQNALYHLRHPESDAIFKYTKIYAAC